MVKSQGLPITVDDNDLGRQDEEPKPEPGEQTDKRQVRLQKEWGCGKRLKRDPY